MTMLEVSEKEYSDHVLPLSVLRKYPNGKMKVIDLE
jgi:hypothetical protein